ncbi:E3 ubiquitin-protein ligase TRIM39-like isoform X4 [Chanos chanos]|uniref:E3 ubiquitin-protein ligase TRIM39-like isoform X4 n=1 Tax=Chanos chanos TaxID=29144 RepID=A0A6J2VUI5_CHACN|nr:E3 ubiquitin-protein ligase TRIM39-like isoform X4 [Chanos chanos]
MASSSSLLSDEQFQCSICLDVFTDPVSTPCGHNFCMTCIKTYWDTSSHCHCPLCKENFTIRPELKINTTLRDVVAHFKRRGNVAKHGEVSCDVCTGNKLKALKSCLVCLTSYCEHHLEPHQRVLALKRHKLIDPVKNLEDYICKKHERPLELFCRDDQTCVCQFCTEGEHRTHNTVPIEEESKRRKNHLGIVQMDVHRLIRDRLRKIQEIKQKVKLSKTTTEKKTAESIEILTALMRSIERVQAEFLELMEEKQKTAEKEAEGVIKKLEQEIRDLKRRDIELEQLSHTEDLLHLLQIYPSVCSPPHTKDWTDISIKTAVSVDTLRRVWSQIEELLEKMVGWMMDNNHMLLVFSELESVQQYAVDVTLDPNTANPNLILSNDRKQVTHGDTQQNLPNNPARFGNYLSVLGKEGFSSGRIYYEVQIGEKTDWDLGVARESIERKGNSALNPENGFWTVWLRNGNEYTALTGPVLLSLKQKPQKVGVFVDYEEGLVNFYDVEAKSHIFSFTGQSFTEKLYPYFNPCTNNGGKNSAPLIITPVSE